MAYLVHDRHENLVIMLGVEIKRIGMISELHNHLHRFLVSLHGFALA
jgi:hypothetical protein